MMRNYAYYHLSEDYVILIQIAQNQHRWHLSTIIYITIPTTHSQLFILKYLDIPQAMVLVLHIWFGGVQFVCQALNELCTY